MSLGTPWMLLLLPVVPLAGWLMARARRLQRDAACRLKGVVPEAGPTRLDRRDWLTLAALACTVLALVRPQWNPRTYAVERRGRDLVIALDVSRSMLAEDVFPSRLEAARISVHEALPALAGQRLALITFAGSASVRVPLTLDHGFVRYMLERADPSDMDLGSTSLQAAFEKAVGTVLTDAVGGRRDMVVFTDGEDHLSDIEQAAELLAKSGARVLIIGLGDPAQGARVPEATGTDQWMRYQGGEVVSRLEEPTLEALAGKSPRVTYYPARTRPFDLVLLYQQLTSGAADDVVVGALQQVRYTEGYPYLLGLAAGLYLASSPWGLPAVRPLMLLALLLSGCARQAEDDGQAAYRARFQRGSELLQTGPEQAAGDSLALRSLLLDAREEFLRAGLLRPGDIEAARQITAITRRLRDLEATIQKERVEAQERRKELSELIEQLQRLVARQARLSQQSSQLLRRRLVPRGADQSKSSDRDNYITDDNTAENSNSERRLARSASAEQQAVSEATTRVLEDIAFQQASLRQLLQRAYGDTGRPPPTELDPAADLLTGALDAQHQALASLVPESVRWPQANSAFHAAAGRMQQALEALRSLLPPTNEEEDTSPPSRNENAYDENRDGTDSETEADRSNAVSAGDFEAALSLQSLPVPNSTAEEILAEETANQQERARKKAARAGAKVEKNW